MKVTLKTTEELIEEGWEQNNRSIHKFLSIDDEREKLSRIFVERALGKQGTLTGISDRGSDGSFSVNVIIDGQKYHGLSPYLFKDKLIRKLKIERLALGDRSDRIKFDGFTFHFGCREISVADALLAAKFIARCAPKALR